MSVFEQLIDELKEENLLEETVFSLNDPSRSELSYRSDNRLTDTGIEVEEDPHFDRDQPEAAHTDFEIEHENEINSLDEPAHRREVQRRRAMEEVSSLQMVEHVLSGIEREHMKISPAVFDDLEVKKALHKYLQGIDSTDTDAHSDAEYTLFQETGKWFSALSERDSNISVANVRRFCENSKPVLSSQALMSLARFYRNSAYSEAVRGKFDFVITRLFARELDDAKRKLLFGRDEMLGHIRTLYSNWASLAVFDVEDEKERLVSETVAGFEAFMVESNTAESFGQLVTTEFFDRIRLFKEQTNELFYEPSVTVAAIECNVKIGNRFVELIQKEREHSDEATIEKKYGYSYDTSISYAASKTLLLIDLLRESRELTRSEESVDSTRAKPKIVEFERAPVEDGSRSRFLSVNRWLVFATLITLVVAAGIYFWSENAATAQKGIQVAKSVDLSSTDLKAHLSQASMSSETLYGVTLPTWDALSDDEKKEFLSKALQFAKSNRMNKVNLLNVRGRTVAFASDNRVDVLEPR